MGDTKAVTITAATADDTAEVSALLEQLGYQISLEAASTGLARLSATENDPVFLFRCDNQALGLLMLHLAPSITHPGGRLRITVLVVAESARGQGVGRALVEHTIAVARQRGCDMVELTSGTARTEAHAFYDGLGFEMTSLRFGLKITEER